MSLKLITPAQQLEQIESIIEFFREYGFSNKERLNVLKVIAADLRGRIPKETSEAVTSLERRLAAVMRAEKDENPSRDIVVGGKVGVAEEVIARWPVIRQALELYDNHVRRFG